MSETPTVSVIMNCLNGARYLELNTSHISNWEQPEAFTRAVLDFLTQ